LTLPKESFIFAQSLFLLTIIIYQKMVLTREKVIKSMTELPAEFSLDDLVERLILLQKIETGLQQAKEGNMISHEEVKRRVQAWRK
jgi:hypothetical protein